MLRLTLEAEDLAATRFAISPIDEISASLHRRAKGGINPATAPWEATIEATLAAATDLDRELLEALTGPRGWTPDFLSPYPERPEERLADELAVVRATDGERLARDFRDAYGGAPLPRVVRTGLRQPRAFAGRIADLLEAYWAVALAPWWPRMHAVVQADIQYRSRRLVQEGMGALFADLHRTVRWDGRVLHVAVGDPLQLDVDVAGRRLPLVPTVFSRRPMVLIDPELPPVIAYPARGAATVFADDASATEEDESALADLLGRGRARILLALDEPVSTTDLAHRLGVTPGGVSQHLGVLARSGLALGLRQGRRVVYRRTELGDQMCAAAQAR
jgi:DNA-binding MarR family transcriptional regulator